MTFRTTRALGLASSRGLALLLIATACSAPAPAAAPTPVPAQPTAPPAAAAKTYTIGISQLIPHPVLDVYRQGAIDALAAQGFVEGKNLSIDFQNAQGDVNTAKTIADKFVNEQVDLIFCITTPACLAAQKSSATIPIVFGYVTDPVAAGLVKEAARPGGNMSGVSSSTRVNEQMNMLREVLPNAKAIGTIWNPGEPNSKVLVGLMKDWAAKNDATIVDVNASSSNEVPTAARSLVGKADAIFVTGDNTAQSALPAILKVGEDNKLPVLTSDARSVETGALGAYAFLEEDLGKQTGDMIARVLKGTKPGEIAVEQPKSYMVILNKSAAQRMSVTLPEALLQKAGRVLP